MIRLVRRIRRIAIVLLVGLLLGACQPVKQIMETVHPVPFTPVLIETPREEAVVPKKKEVSDEFILGKETKPPIGCVKGVDC